MLRTFETTEQLNQALNLTADSPFLLAIHYSIRHELQRFFPEVKSSVYGYPYHQPQIWMIIRRNQFTRTHIFIASRTQLFISETDIDNFLMLALPYLLEFSEFSARILGIRLSTRMSELLSSHLDFSAPSYLSTYFLINEAKQRIITEMDVGLAQGYEFGELDPDIDADAVAATWKFSTSGDRDQFAAKIRRMPSVCIRTYDGDLASFTVLDASGFFNNQFTFPEHRQKGLADRSELKLCQKVVQFGLYPMKFVEHENAAVLARSTRSAWWSAVVDESGITVIQDHRIVYRRSSSSATFNDYQLFSREKFEPIGGRNCTTETKTKRCESKMMI